MNRIIKNFVSIFLLLAALVAMGYVIFDARNSLVDLGTSSVEEIVGDTPVIDEKNVNQENNTAENVVELEDSGEAPTSIFDEYVNNGNRYSLSLIHYVLISVTATIIGLIVACLIVTKLNKITLREGFTGCDNVVTFFLFFLLTKFIILFVSCSLVFYGFDRTYFVQSDAYIEEETVNESINLDEYTNDLVIDNKGTYTLSGTLNFDIEINEEVSINLNNAVINGNIINNTKYNLKLYLTEGTNNVLNSKIDVGKLLTVEGKGSLYINGLIDGDYIVNGGTIVFGSNQKINDPGKSKQKVLIINNDFEVGENIAIVDDEGKTIMVFEVNGSYKSILVSSKKLKKGSYIVYKNGTVDGTIIGGMYYDFSYKPGDVLTIGNIK